MEYGRQSPLFPMSDEEVERWWDTPRPLPPADAPKAARTVAAGEATITLQCRGCGQRCEIGILWPARLCGRCISNLDAVEKRLRLEKERAGAALDALSKRWNIYVDALPEQLRASYQRLLDDRCTAELQLIDARHGKRAVRVSAEEILVNIAEAENARAYIEARIAKSREKKPDLDKILTAEEQSNREIRKASARHRALLMALQEVQAARDEGQRNTL